MGTLAKAIGVFDSGVGGLTVLSSIAERLPGEPLIYLGDTARVPYGTKSASTVVRYARGCADLLLKRGIKLLVVACNTASAFALDPLREELDIPVLGVIDPGARRAVEASARGGVGVLGTHGTITSRAYEEILKELAPPIRVYGKACPLLVPLAEEGWLTGDVPRAIIRKYLAELPMGEIDTLLLGCTHYPLFHDAIASLAGGEVTVVDSAGATAEVVAEIVRALGEEQPQTTPSREFLVTDSPDRFLELAPRFFGRPVESVDWVDV